MLDLGDLVGRVMLKDDQFNSVLDMLPEKVRSSGAVSKLAALGVGTLIAGALVQGIDTAVTLEATNDKIAASWNLTQEQAMIAGQVTGQLYADAYGDSIESVSDAVGIVYSSFDGMRNASAETVESITAKLFNVQTALGVDISRAAQVAGQSVKAGLASGPDEAIDLLVANLQRVPEALRGDLVDAVDEYGPILANMGFTGEEAFGMLADAADKGMYGIDKTGDALKEFSIRATDMSTASGAAYAQLGMDQQAATERILAGGDSARQMFEEVVQGLLNIQDPAAQSQAALALFGTPLEDLGTAEIPQFLDTLVQVKDGFGETAGAADAMGETLNGNAATSWTQLSRTWESIVGQVGGALLPILDQLLSWANENPAVLQIVAAALGVLALAFIGVTIATWAMNTALLANPITWIILAIVALIAAIVLLVMNWDTVVAWISEVWGGFIGWITDVINGFVSWWNGVWEGFASWIGEVWQGFVDWIVAVWQGFVDWIMAVLIGYGQFWISIWTGISDFVVSVWNGFIGFVTDAFNNFMLGLQVIGSAIATWWNGLWQGIWNWIVSAVSGMLAWATGAVNGFVSWWNGAWSAVGSFFSNLWNGLISGVQAAWGNIIGFFQGIPGQILGFFSGIGSWLYQAGSDLINGLMEGIGSMAGQIGSFFLNLLPGWIVGPFKAALGIASPSKVFAAFGENIGEGIMVGLDRVQGDLDARMSAAVTVPPVDMALRPGKAAYEAYSATAGQVGRSVNVDAPVTIMGNVGWDKDELERESAQRQRDALALAGVDEVTVS